MRTCVRIGLCMCTCVCIGLCVRTCVRIGLCMRTCVRIGLYMRTCVLAVWCVGDFKETTMFAYSLLHPKSAYANTDANCN